MQREIWIQIGTDWAYGMGSGNYRGWKTLMWLYTVGKLEVQESKGPSTHQRPADSTPNMGQCFSWRLRAGKHRCPSTTVRQEELPVTLSCVALPGRHLIRCGSPRMGGQCAWVVLPIRMLRDPRKVNLGRTFSPLRKQRSSLENYFFFKSLVESPSFSLCYH